MKSLEASDQEYQDGDRITYDIVGIVRGTGIIRDYAPRSNMWVVELDHPIIGWPCRYLAVSSAYLRKAVHVLYSCYYCGHNSNSAEEATTHVSEKHAEEEANSKDAFTDA